MATSAQLPQVDAQPVMLVSSAKSRAPAAAASRTARSVMPLQMQTYMAHNLSEIRHPHSNLNTNDCQ